MSTVIDGDELREAAAMLRKGQLVAFPTETVYGLGANALMDSAVQSIFAAKGRPSDNPLIVHVSNLDSARILVSRVPDIVERLAERFWPGPLSIVLPIATNSGLSKFATAGLDCVGIRVPDHPVALQLLREANVPVAAPSANKSGSPSPTTAAHVLNDFVDIKVLNGGSCRVGLESTVIKITEGGKIRILRPGGISREQLEDLAGDSVEIGYLNKSLDHGSAPEAPGMKYRHYAPKATVLPFESEEQLNRLITEQPSTNKCVIIAFEDVSLGDPDLYRISLGSLNDVDEASRRIFAALRTCDDLHANTAFIDVRFDKTCGAGVALWNRISKAAAGATDKL